jgi:hypothetical protein
MGTHAGEVGLAEELMLFTPDMIVDEIERLHAESDNLDREILRLEAIRKGVNRRYNRIQPLCPHKREGEWDLECGEDRFAGGGVHMRCRICNERMSCPHPDPRPFFGGQWCEMCDCKQYFSGKYPSGRSGWTKVKRG